MNAVDYLNSKLIELDIEAQSVRFLIKLKNLLRKSVLLILSIIFQYNFIYRLVGILNKYFNLINSIFVCYPGNEKYLLHLSFKSFSNFVKWKPSPIGIMYQGGKFGLVVGVPMVEDEFTKIEYSDELAKVIKRIEEIGSLLNIKLTNYSGILPSYLSKNNIIKNADTKNNKVTKVVVEAILTTLDKEFKNKKTPIILFGGAGNLGIKIQEELSSVGINNLHIVDPRVGVSEISDDLKLKPALLVNVSSGRAIDKVVNNLWKGVVILNESYPEPSKRTLTVSSTLGIKVFHVGGVQGNVFPELPFGYKGCVPCCAMHVEDFRNIIIKELN